MTKKTFYTNLDTKIFHEKKAINKEIAYKSLIREISKETQIRTVDNHSELRNIFINTKRPNDKTARKMDSNIFIKYKHHFVYKQKRKRSEVGRYIKLKNHAVKHRFGIAHYRLNITMPLVRSLYPIINKNISKDIKYFNKSRYVFEDHRVNTTKHPIFEDVGRNTMTLVKPKLGGYIAYAFGFRGFLENSQYALIQKIEQIRSQCREDKLRYYGFDSQKARLEAMKCLKDPESTLIDEDVFSTINPCVLIELRDIMWPRKLPTKSLMVETIIKTKRKRFSKSKSRKKFRRKLTYKFLCHHNECLAYGLIFKYEYDKKKKKLEALKIYTQIYNSYKNPPFRFELMFKSWYRTQLCEEKCSEIYRKSKKRSTEDEDKKDIK